MAFYFLAVQYDVSKLFLELTLLRFAFAWVASAALCLAVPRAIGATKSEIKAAFHPGNLAFKALGSGCILITMLQINRAL